MHSLREVTCILPGALDILPDVRKHVVACDSSPVPNRIACEK